MKYTKPGFAYSGCQEGEGIVVGYVAAELLRFLKSLPAEFEIVEPGNVQVKWPTCAYRGAMEFSADTCDMTGHKGTAILLRALAAIAPVEKKKRKVGVWKRDGYGVPAEVALVPVEETPTFCSLGWRKVGECEVDT